MRKKDCCIFDNSPLSPVPYIQKREKENTKDSKIELTETSFFFFFLTPPFVSKIEIVIEKVNKIRCA
jgi:hypothetical protein